MLHKDSIGKTDSLVYGAFLGIIGIFLSSLIKGFYLTFYLIRVKTNHMADEKTLSVSLEEFGLSKYEAQAYVTLISKGTISASELSYYSELPRTKVYSVLQKLEKKRLAISSKSKPVMYTPIAPEDAFDGIIQEQINKVNAMNTLVTNLKKINEVSRGFIGIWCVFRHNWHFFEQFDKGILLDFLLNQSQN